MEHYSVQFLGPGWVELPPYEPARPIDIDDWRVQQAKVDGKKFLLGTVKVASIANSAKDDEIARLTAELDESKDNLVASQVEATNLRARTSAADEAKAVAERNFAARTTELSQIREQLEKAEAALLVATSMPKVDATELTNAELKVTDLTARLDEAVKAKEEQGMRFGTLRDECVKLQRECEELVKKENAATDKVGGLEGQIDALKKEIETLKAAKSAADPTLLAEKDALIGKKDQRIKELEGLLKAEKEKPQATYRESAFYERWYRNKEWKKIGAAVATLLLLTFLLFNGIFHWTVSTPDPSGRITTLQKQVTDLQTSLGNKDETIRQKDGVIFQKDEIIRGKIADSSPKKSEPAKDDSELKCPTGWRPVKVSGRCLIE